MREARRSRTPSVPARPPLRVHCARCGGEFETTLEMRELSEASDTYVHACGCGGYGPGWGVTAPLALVGAVLVFLGGLWLFAQAPWFYPIALVAGVAGCWLCVLVIARAGEDR